LDLTTTDAILLVGFGWVAFELRALRRQQQEQQEQADIRRQEAKQARLDRRIERECPTLFLRYRDRLRSWYDQLGHNRELIARGVDPHPIGWFEFCAETSAKCSDQGRRQLADVRAVTEDFIRNAANTPLTNIEVAFLCYSAWDNFLEAFNPNPKTAADTAANRNGLENLKRALAVPIALYGKNVQMDAERSQMVNELNAMLKESSGNRNPAV
jgi:hypothetical protein